MGDGFGVVEGVVCGGGEALSPGGLDGEGEGVDAPPPHLALLQSTGRLTTGLQVAADFCFGRSGKQLLVSSSVMSVLEGGSHALASPLK